MASSAELVINIRATNASALRAIEALNRSVSTVERTASRSFSEASRSANSFGSTLTSVAGRIGAYFIARGIVRLGQSMFELASDAEETESMFISAMGNMEDSAREFTSKASDALGIYETDLKRNVATIYNITKSMGLNEKQALTLSTAMTGLAMDMASFYNLPHSEAFTAIRSGLVGETEPLRRLGVLTTEASLAEFARQKGIEKSVTKMNEQEKMMLRGIAVMEQTKTAQGDMSRTLSSSANMLRVLTSIWKEAISTWGQVLLPLMTQLFMVFMVIGRALTLVGEKVKALTGVTASQAQASDNARKSSQALVSGEKVVAKTIGKTTKAVKGSLASFDEMIAIRGEASSGSAGKDSGVGSGIDPDLLKQFEELGNFDFGQNISGKLDEILKPWEKKIKPFIEDIKKIFKDFDTKSVIDSFDRIMKTDFVKSFGTNVGEVVKSFATVLKDTVPLAIGAFTLALEGLEKFLNGDFKGAWEDFTGSASKLKTAFEKAEDELVNLIERLWESGASGKVFAIIITVLVIKALVAVARKTIEWGEKLIELGKIVVDALKEIKQFALYLWSKLVPIYGRVVLATRAFATSLRLNLIPALSSARLWLIFFATALWTKVRLALQNAIAWTVNFAKTLAKGAFEASKFAWTLMKDVSKALWGYMKAIGKAIYQTAVFAWKLLVTAVKSVGQFLKSLYLLVTQGISKAITALGLMITSAYATATAFVTAHASALGWTLIIVALVALIIYLWETNEGFRKAVTYTWESISWAVRSAWAYIKKLFYTMARYMMFELPQSLYELDKAFATVFLGIKQLIASVWNAIITEIQRQMQSFLEIINSVIDSINEAMVGVFKLNKVKINLSGVKINTKDYLNENLAEIAELQKEINSLETSKNLFNDKFAEGLNPEKYVADEHKKSMKTIEDVAKNIGGKYSIVQPIKNLATEIMKGAKTQFDSIISDFKTTEVSVAPLTVNIDDDFKDAIKSAMNDSAFSSVDSFTAPSKEESDKLSSLADSQIKLFDRIKKPIEEAFKAHVFAENTNGLDGIINSSLKELEGVTGSMKEALNKDLTNGVFYKDEVPTSAIVSGYIPSTPTEDLTFNLSDYSMDNLVSAFANVVKQEQETSVQQDTKPISVNLMLDSKVLAKGLLDPLEKEAKKQGVNFMTLGAV